MIKKILGAAIVYIGLPSNIYFIAIARLILGLGNFILPFMLLLLTERFNYSATIATSLTMGVTGAYFIGSMLGGKLSDKIGHKHVFVYGELAGAVVLLACGFFLSTPIVIPFLLFGAYLFFGLALPASNALVADLSNPKNRDAIMSLSYLAFNLGSSVGPLVAGYLFWDHTHWIFWGNGLTSLIGALIVLFGVTSIYKEKITTQKVLSNVEFEQPIAGTIWTILSERPRIIIFSFLCSLMWVVMTQMTVANPLYLNFMFDSYGPVLFGQLCTFSCLAIVLITPILITLTSKKSDIITLAYSGIFFSVGYLLVMSGKMIPTQFIAWFFLSAGEILLYTKEGIYLANQSPISHRGRIQSFSISIRYIFLMPSFILIGFAIDNFGYQYTWMLIILIAVLPTFGFIIMDKFLRKNNLIDNANKTHSENIRD
ncbi:MFS transporter [Providencia burhodogranariea]|uniref:MDR-type permease n=1 Tax=Providencia burhodogranariea DSM 19968 TaxID=1141662 RepID=K8VXN8_9GAMM|nr:MFS transporter [Providencia burhodogranariea]EKT52904.1 MDR-type permease [Providencia burhodogranariea DSM 19968]